jgi:uncharacterized protein (DUF2267 family)
MLNKISGEVPLQLPLPLRLCWVDRPCPLCDLMERSEDEFLVSDVHLSVLADV